MSTDVECLDFTGPPPGCDELFPLRRQTAAWAKYKVENDPPGIATHESYDGTKTFWLAQVLDRPGEIAGPTSDGQDVSTEDLARAAAWRWYEARVELYGILRKLNPPREFWPVILTWSDQQWIEVHTFLVENFDDFLLGCADMLTFPEVLRG